MASLLCHNPLLLHPCSTMASSPVSQRSHSFPSPHRRSFNRGTSVIARISPFELMGSEDWTRDLVGRAENFLYFIADAGIASVDDATVEPAKQRDWLSGITDVMEYVLKVLKDALSSLHVPYSYGFAIILLTILVKAATFPLTKRQVESSLAVRSLQPQVKAIQERFSGDPEKIQLETARLYKVAGVNPFAGCLPTLATIPVWIGLYRALSNVANEGLLTEGFFWIPSLAGPTTIASRQSGAGTSWLFPFLDGHPPLGWSDTAAYLVLPVLLVISQYVSAQILQPPQSNDPNQSSSQAVTKILPLMIGYFSLSVPSGLSLYWFTNNILSIGQQVWLQKLGGTKNLLREPQEPQKSQKSEYLVQTNITNDLQDLKSELTKPHAGERFKKLKEEEAKRKREREQENKSEKPNSRSIHDDSAEQHEE
ncbi:ALBINO3-like protein 1, chloroplastic isoform X2 [Wolffia australiana]